MFICVFDSQEKFEVKWQSCVRPQLSCTVFILLRFSCCTCIIWVKKKLEFKDAVELDDDEYFLVS